MDPLTITSTVISISARCIRSARALYVLREKYKDASITITAIYSESTVISTSLAHIQGLISKNPDALRSTLQERPELEDTFDQALTGCVLVYSVLDDEVQKLYGGVGKDGIAGMMGRARFLWREEAMRDVLVQIRGQQTALGLLIQALQMSSIADIRSLLQNNTEVLKNVAQRTSTFRQANPKVKAPSSLFEFAVDDVASLYSVNSTATSTNFIFDDVVVNSQVYRRALNSSRNNMNLGAVQEQSENSSDAESVVEGASAPEAQKWKIPQGIRSKLSPGEISNLLKIMEEARRSQSENDTVAMLPEFQELIREHDLLREKYIKVKRYYFEQDEKLKRTESALEIAKASHAPTVVERDELEHTKSFLVGQIADLEKANENHARYFQECETARKKLIESHHMEVVTRNESLSLVEELLKNAQENVRELKDTNKTKTTKIEELEKGIKELELEHQGCAAEVKACEDQIAKLVAERRAREEEIQRYKGFDSIIEQLRALSPVPPTSPGATSFRTSSVEFTSPT